MTIYGPLVRELDDQIKRLTTARNALADIDGNKSRPKQGIMSADARERIAEAQRKRWARVEENEQVEVSKANLTR